MKSQFAKYRLPAACLAAILLAGVAPRIATAATTNQHYQFKGLTAQLSEFSASGSVYTQVFISATQGTGQDPSGVYVDVYQYNDADPTNITEIDYNAAVPVTSSQFQISSSLQSASLNVMGVVLQDSFGNAPPVTVDVSATWTGSGGQPTAISKSVYSFQTVTPGQGLYSDQYRSRGLVRDASLVGSLVLNGTDVLAGATSPYGPAGALSKGNSVEIYRTKGF